MWPFHILMIEKQGGLALDILAVKKLSRIYEGKVSHKALEHIEFTVKKGEFVGIMGPSGSGKTTLLNLIATIDEPTSGEILINEENPHLLKRDQKALFRRRELGFVFQHFNLLETLTVAENIVLPLSLEDVPVKTMKASVQAIAEKLGIEHILEKRTYEISGGQAQRTAIARAIIHQPSLILADEPTGNLDSKASKDCLQSLVMLKEQEASTILMVTHDPAAASFCDRVIFIKDGRFYNEIYQGKSRQAFFQKIIDMLSLLGGEHHDLSTIRL